jgi:glutamate-1-semialdehyde 2,1-aminomutase
MKNFFSKLHKFIPGGAHTYSKGDDQFPSNAPKILFKGKGAYVYDQKNQKFLDYGMGLRSVNIGYAENIINKAAIKEINKGNNLSKPSEVEFLAAKNFIKTIKNADMVKFTKNGSSAVTAAVKLSRAYNNKKKILICKQHPFFSFDDWFIGSTKIKRGVPKEIQKLTIGFDYNDIIGLRKIIKRNKNSISCLVTEAVTTECPKIDFNTKGCCNKLICERNYKKSNHFLKDVQSLCQTNNIVFILDEMITGFRWNISGAQEFFNIEPDLSTFGKSMANGFSLAAVCGKKKIMQLGSINKKNRERVFLLSTTHGAEMSSLGAFNETIRYFNKKKVLKHNAKYAFNLISKANKLIKIKKLQDYVNFRGPVFNPSYICKDANKKESLEFKTLFMQEMIKNKVIMPYISVSYRHKAIELKKTINALNKTLDIYAIALKKGYKKYLKGPVIKPVFRKFN